MAGKVVKVLVCSAVGYENPGKVKLELIKEIHGENVEIAFDTCDFSGPKKQQVKSWLAYLGEKITIDEFFCYLMLPDYLVEALRTEKISFGVFQGPKKKMRIRHITAEHYGPEKSEPVVKARREIGTAKKQSRFVNNSGKGRATHQRTALARR